MLLAFFYTINFVNSWRALLAVASKGKLCRVGILSRVIEINLLRQTDFIGGRMQAVSILFARIYPECYFGVSAHFMPSRHRFMAG